MLKYRGNLPDDWVEPEDEAKCVCGHVHSEHADISDDGDETAHDCSGDEGECECEKFVEDYSRGEK